MGVKFRKKHYEGVWFNVFSVMGEWVGVKFPEKNITQVYGLNFLPGIVTRGWLGVKFTGKTITKVYGTVY